MENITKVFFDPLLASKEAIVTFVESLPVGSAHPFRNGNMHELLIHSEPDVISTLDVSMHSEDYFTNAVSMGDLGEQVLDRMKLFTQIKKFNDEYTIQQAPAATFTVPLIADEIHIFAVSQLEPTYYDLCAGNANNETSCYGATNTFPGLTHSADILQHGNLLQTFSINEAIDDTPLAIFVSGYNYSKLYMYRAYNPIVLVVNHRTKALYTIPVPLDAATIGDATICCPFVFKRQGDSLRCSVLPAATVDSGKMCTGVTMPSRSLTAAIARADFTSHSLETPVIRFDQNSAPVSSESVSLAPSLSTGMSVVLSTQANIHPLPIAWAAKKPQVITFGQGITWVEQKTNYKDENISTCVLPCILGGILGGPMILANGRLPCNIPFQTKAELHQYYRLAKSIVVIVDQQMTDNARNLAPPWRLNALFIVKGDGPAPKDGDDVVSALNKVNINAVTALAGPQSLIVVHFRSNTDKYYFYRGVAEPKVLDTSQLSFGDDLTDILTEQISPEELLNASWSRIVDLDEDNPVYLPKSKRSMTVSELRDTFENSTPSEIFKYKDDITVVLPQLQVLLDQDKLQDLCSSLIEIVSSKISEVSNPARKEYARFLSEKYDASSSDSRAKKDRLLSSLRKLLKENQSNFQWLTQLLGNVISAQTSSTRIYDLKRLLRQNAIQSNVNMAKSLTYEAMGTLLEEHAEQMGVLVVNIETDGYRKYLAEELYKRNPRDQAVCSLDSRTLYLDGLDAGIILEQSQSEHEGPLVSLLGKASPIMALANLDKTRESGSMLAWVCWDEFVSLSDPYSLRWMEKCNEPHIAGLRIITRGTLASAVSSRAFHWTPQSPEIGDLMSSLLISSMFKLAATKNDLATLNAEDTSTRLMRGLYGNLLTIAGSGVKPLSFVWQLFGVHPQLEVPNKEVQWIWYEAATRLFPYTAWNACQYQENLIGLLDKILFRVMSTNESLKDSSQSRKAKLEEYCKARNIQLSHSRTIILALRGVLQLDGKERQEAATRMLDFVPASVKHQTESYRRLHRYIVHLAAGGKHRVDDNLIAASVFTKRSAAFGTVKHDIHKYIKTNDRQKVIESCKALIKKRTEIEEDWCLEANSVKIQGLANIEEIVNGRYSSGEELSKLQIARVRDDAEKNRQPWQIGKGEFGALEELDVDIINHIIGTTSEVTISDGLLASAKPVSTAVVPQENEFDQYADSMAPGFVKSVQNASSISQVCAIIKVPGSAMEAFGTFLAPSFDLAQLPHTFRNVVLGMLQDRSRDAGKVKPTLKLFGGLIEKIAGPAVEQITQ